MSVAARKDALQAWFASATGLTTIWANQDGVRPAYPYAVLNLIADTSVGLDEQRSAYDTEAEEGEEIVLTTRGDRQWTLSCQVFALAGAHDASPQYYLSKARARLALPSVLASLGAALLAVAAIMPIQDFTTAVNGQPLMRGAMDVQFNTVDGAGFEAPGAAADTPDTETYIETVEGSLNDRDIITTQG